MYTNKRTELIDTSLPARGAWIEIGRFRGTLRTSESRSPQGERGLKFGYISPYSGVSTSLPARGAWIEIDWLTFKALKYLVAPRKGSVD